MWTRSPILYRCRYHFEFSGCRLMSIICCLLFRINVRSAIRGISMIIYLLNTKALAEVFNAALAAYLVTCITIASSLSTIWFACATLAGEWLCKIVHSISPIVWWAVWQSCVCLMMLTVVRTGLIPYCPRSCTHSDWRESHPLSWTHLFGLGYLASQQLSKWSLMWRLFFELILIMCSKLVTGSLHVRALNKIVRSLILTVQRHIRSTATSLRNLVQLQLNLCNN